MEPMRVIDGLLVRARRLGRAVGDGVVDSGQALLYLRQLLRGNRAEPAIPRTVTVAAPGADPAVAAAPGVGPEGAATRAATATGSEDRAAAPPVLLIHGYLATRGSVHL